MFDDIYAFARFTPKKWLKRYKNIIKHIISSNNICLALAHFATLFTHCILSHYSIRKVELVNQNPVP